MKKDTCAGCKAYAPMSNECRRHAPVMVPVPQQDPVSGKLQGCGAFGLWPATRAESWCCEFIPDVVPQ